MPIKTSMYPNLFKYQIYEAFKPQNLKSARNYLRYLTSTTKELAKTPELNRYIN